MRRRLAAWLRALAAWLDRPGADDATEPPEWSKHDGSEPKRAAIEAYVASVGRELGITPSPSGDVWRFYEIPDMDMQPSLSRVHGGRVSKGGTNPPPSVHRPPPPKAEGHNPRGYL